MKLVRFAQKFGLALIWLYAMVWFVDIKLSVWDANGKMVRFGITGGFFVLLIMAAIAEVAIGIFFRDQVPTLFSIEEFYYGEGNVPTR